MSTDDEHGNDKDIFDAYVSLRKIAQKYRLEEKLAIPRVVFVGETSSGKSMLVQNFLRFPCAFSHGDVGTRRPVLYRLRYNPTLDDDTILVKHPANIKKAEDLADHLREVMQQLEVEQKFSLEEYLVHVESKQYRDFEIVDVPGLVGGAHDNEQLIAVETITEHYVRDPTFLIVQLKESTQIGVNASGIKRIQDLCLIDPAPRGSSLPPRINYQDYTITIQTKFDLFMDGHKDGTLANEDIKKLVKHFNERTLFVSMIFDVYNFSNHTYDENLKYIDELAVLEHQRVTKWINGMKKLSQQSNNKSEEFNEDQYRPLIGINLVRSYIQDMWVKAFRGAFPNIQQVLNELVQEQKQRYEIILRQVEEKDLKTLRSTYQHYIECFRGILTGYVNYRAEIFPLFPHERYGRTYLQIEEEYNKWSRKIPLTWCAYQTAEELSKNGLNRGLVRSLYSLTERYIGARHFERIRQVFFYMILTYQPPGFAKDFIETANSLLYGVTSDNENVGKAVREVFYTYIRQTFCLGICWLTQIYSFLIDHFEQQVTSVLLRPDGEFAHLATGHTKFLSYVRLEYHKITRKFIRRAVEATKHARYAKMEYAALSTCHFLRTLVESFPPTIKNNQQKENPISDSNLHQLIYDSESSLPENRNSETGNYLPAARSIVNELFTAVRGLLLNDITTNFFSNIVTKLGQYNSIRDADTLRFRINKMSNKQIAQMSHMNLDENIKELQIVYEKLKLLEQARDELAQASQVFDGKTTFNGNEKKQEKKNILYEKRDRVHQELMSKLYDVKLKKSENSDGELSSNDDDDNGNVDDEDGDNDEHELKTLNNDPHTCQIYLLELFRQHDLEDLRLSFLEGDSFNMNKPIQVQEHHPLKVDNNIFVSPPPIKKNSDKDDISVKSDDGLAAAKQFDDVHLYDSDSSSVKPRTTVKKPKITWPGNPFHSNK